MVRCGFRALLLLAALAASGFAAADQATPPPDRGHRAFSLREAPENLVYRFFFSELIGSQRAADQRRDSGKDDTGLRSLFQRRLRLNEPEHQVLISAAQACVSAQEAGRREMEEVAAELKTTQDKASLRARMQALQRADEDAVANSVKQLRLELGAERFAEVNLRIRAHVVPNLKVVPGSGPRTRPSGGN